MKRTCYGCRSLWKSSASYSCFLGYEFAVDHRSYVEVDPRPTVECPKPKTWLKFYALVAERDAALNKAAAARKG